MASIDNYDKQKRRPVIKIHHDSQFPTSIFRNMDLNKYALHSKAPQNKVEEHNHINHVYISVVNQLLPSVMLLA